ncbi:hypothetical protein IMCC3317_33600 [Kordia antarctica]|uniref:Endonuclease GajA/Old nuclease/RecF-like AAA domain-containing protein n=1 Tax=Kordia antarctica TaxID=1218801 RepID=A0A7L4ZNC2_9FLAO|nr:AAA family ATPase [Kordia antarctica]QHI37977.1 hypothetical protein IMCC3317_33600 [Kordia antarctica]
MKEKLIIKNFGPIKSVDLDLGKINVLIGEQATGKSTIAKVLSICRYFSYIVNYSIDIESQHIFHNNEQFYKGLKDWGIDEYLQDASEFFYENELYTFEFKNKLITEFETVTTTDDLKKEYYQTETRIHSNSTNFTKLLNELESLKKDEEVSDKVSETEIFYASGWTPNENFYRLNVKKVMDNPLFIPAERGFQSVSVSKDSLLSTAILDELAKINRIVREYRTDIEIKPLSLIFRNENGLSKVKKIDTNDFHYLHTGASGYQSTIPTFLAIKYYSEIEKRKRTITVEEPELNLFPKTQKKLVEFFIESINQSNNKFILPTHSPYILTTLSNLIYAHKVGTTDNGKFEKEVNEIISKKAWIDVNDISVYFLNNGQAKDLVDVKECLINLDDLDNVSETINSEFDELLNIEMKSISDE